MGIPEGSECVSAAMPGHPGPTSLCTVQFLHWQHQNLRAMNSSCWTRSSCLLTRSAGEAIEGEGGGGQQPARQDAFLQGCQKTGPI